MWVFLEISSRLMNDKLTSLEHVRVMKTPTTHFYIEKLGFTRVYVLFLFLL